MSENSLPQTVYTLMRWGCDDTPHLEGIFSRAESAEDYIAERVKTGHKSAEYEVDSVTIDDLVGNVCRTRYTIDLSIPENEKRFQWTSMVVCSSSEEGDVEIRPDNQWIRAESYISVDDAVEKAKLKRAEVWKDIPPLILTK